MGQGTLWEPTSLHLPSLRFSLFISSYTPASQGPSLMSTFVAPAVSPLDGIFSSAFRTFPPPPSH